MARERDIVEGRARWLAWPIFALTILMTAVVAAILVYDVGILGHSLDTSNNGLRFEVPMIGVGFVTIGAVVTSRLPRNPVGWIFLFGGFEAAVQTLMQEYGLQADYAATGTDSLLHLQPGAARAAGYILGWLASAEGEVTFVAFLSFIIFLYPDGRFVSNRWKGISWVGAGILIFEAVSHLFFGGGPPRVLNAITLGHAVEVQAALNIPLGPLLLFVPPLLALSSLVVRYRRAASEQRQQIKWVMYATAVVIASLIFIDAVLALVVGRMSETQGRLISAASIATILLIPVAAGVAILKYRLYDIDVVISRTLVYGALAAFITAVYVGIVVGIGRLAGSGGRPNLVLSILATAVVAVAFQPVRERMQKIANRLVYGKRATPYEVLSDFSQRVAESYSADQVLPRMARVLAEGTGAKRADVWLRTGAMLRQAASWPDDSATAEPARIVDGQMPELPDTDRAIAVAYQGDLLGAVAITKRRGETLTPVEEKLLQALGSQAGLVLRNVGLRADLLARLEDLRNSRQRLVAAQDEERRRLERNLHDGAQQNLVALKVKLGLVEMLTEKDPVRARAMLAELKADTDEALETLRDLARGIYPPLLADKGLAAAVQAQARKAILAVDVHADAIGRYPQETEAAVYFCVLEALQNVQKYAEAGQAIVRLRRQGEELLFEVEDDGKGFDPATRKKGSGTQNMEDRLEALGGTVAVTSALGRGTRVAGALPIRVVAPAG